MSGICWEVVLCLVASVTFMVRYITRKKRFPNKDLPTSSIRVRRMRGCWGEEGASCDGDADTGEQDYVLCRRIQRQKKP